MNIKRFGPQYQNNYYMSYKVIPISTKMPRPTLQEMVEYLDRMVKNYTNRGESDLNILLTSLSYSIWHIKKITEDDEEVLALVDDILEQYIEVNKPRVTFNDYSIFDDLGAKNDKNDD